MKHDEYDVAIYQMKTREEFSLEILLNATPWSIRRKFGFGLDWTYGSGTYQEFRSLFHSGLGSM